MSYEIYDQLQNTTSTLLIFLLAELILFNDIFI